ncbi:MAG: beta-N-acetylhexosaminidase [Tepidisphaerales bacterium]
MPMDCRSAAARLLAVGFEGTTVTPELRRLLEAGVSAVILFARNVPPPPEAYRVRELTAAIKAAAGRPVLICIDQEGGRVARLKAPFTAVPSMRQIGASPDAEQLAADAGTVLGRELRWAGIDVDFAPVMDVDSNPANPVIADRAFGPDPALVSRLGTRLIRAMQRGDGGVAACAKHFPGHGDTAQDSHHDLPRLDHDLRRLESVELPPFEAAVRAGVAAVMSAHVIFTPLDPAYPATMSPAALGGLLRGRMGFGGVVFSDDLEMKAVASHFPFEDQLLRGLDAGLDLFTICHSPELQWKAIELLASGLEHGRIAHDRVAASHRRIDRLTADFYRPVTPDAGPSLADVQGGHADAIARLAALGPYVNPRDPTQYR